MSEMVGLEWTLSPHKRALDLLGITALMPLFVPAGALIATAIHRTDEMDPLFVHTRYGLEFEPFPFYKFRTMPEDTPPETPSSGISDDRRTALGAKLSGKHLDEMPQTINIYNGTMSLVGARALVQEDVSNTLDLLTPAEQKLWIPSRCTAKPGVFGWFQLRQVTAGYETGDSYEESVRERAFADIQYSQEGSFRTDMSIVLATAKAAYDIISNKAEKTNQLRGESGAAMFQSVAEGFGIVVSAGEHEYWRAALLAARCLDNAVDEFGNTDMRGLVGDLLKGKPVVGMTADEAEAFEAMYLQQTPDRQKRLINTFLALPDFAINRRNAQSFRRLVHINKTEAYMFGDILCLDEHDSVRVSFNKWLRLFARAGYLVDTVLDARKDFEDGNISIEPTAFERGTLGLRALVDSSRVLAGAPYRSYPKLAKGAAKTLFTNVLK